MWPHRRQPTRLHHPWDSPGKNTEVGCHFCLQCMKVKSEVTQSCPTLSKAMNCSPPGSSIHGIFQARVLEWGAIAFSEGWVFKPTFSLLSLSSRVSLVLCFLPGGWCHLHIWGYWYFSWKSWFQLDPAQHFTWCTWAYRIPKWNLLSVSNRLKPVWLLLISMIFSVTLCKYDMLHRYIFCLCRAFHFDFYENYNSCNLYKLSKCQAFYLLSHLQEH